ncbi:MAG: phosphoglycerate dehydrogenase [bacterium (Candidatus Ratteibacteria) CG15_BIG_FIL_POST_REV_8_21_14_020_41_12]|uniref:D-3-phosphoglycerate dehydrogenase n=1 Tax=bacterium (Candidatus Ratteibacteria) CG15_BIG_FIL_POST_REV_8_21_14_020_41_12 TaxID=2014291 RepID=A0A2M7H069_9BACT|nr:MAG: phosphoglycerate dehydrogenase [bacterium (Candidatus Ratteibacteria) CG15_BIG_FIL_POST_REV_8_21_14_020_41_12]
MKILVTDPLAKEGLDVLEKEGFEVDCKGKLSPEDLAKVIPGYDALIVRSGTRAPREVIEKATNLKVIGRAGVGLDNVDIEAATAKGIIVMNSPEGNTISTAEHTLAMILALARNIPQADCSLKSKVWEKKKFTGSELYGKTLGIIGLGRIGSYIARVAVSLGMKIVGHDPFISPEKAAKIPVKIVDLKELCRVSDYITVHTPLTSETKGIIGKKEFKLMKKGVRIINCARGGIIEERALCEALKEEKVKGAALDVYEKEPPLENPLLGFDNVITTPHLGASTQEAQINVARDIAQQICDFLKRKISRYAANIPAVDEKLAKIIGPYFILAEKIGILMGQLMPGNIMRIGIEYQGEIAEYDVSSLRNNLIKGLLKPSLGDQVNYVNAPLLAKERGIKISETKTISAEEFANLVSCKVETDNGDLAVSGTLLSKNDLRIVKIDGYPINALPQDYLLICRNEDKPGIIGQIGTILGEREINIAGMTLGRKKKGGLAITVLNIDRVIPTDDLKRIQEISAVKSAKLVKL